MFETVFCGALGCFTVFQEVRVFYGVLEVVHGVSSCFAVFEGVCLSVSQSVLGCFVSEWKEISVSRRTS